MTPSPAERDELFKAFARALFKGDIDALYQAVTPDFLWSFHDGLAVTKSLTGREAIQKHLDEQRAVLSAQRSTSSRRAARPPWSRGSSS